MAHATMNEGRNVDGCDRRIERVMLKQRGVAMYAAELSDRMGLKLCQEHVAARDPRG
jgi:hypothetical protein